MPGFPPLTAQGGLARLLRRAGPRHGLMVVELALVLVMADRAAALATRFLDGPAPAVAAPAAAGIVAAPAPAIRPRLDVDPFHRAAPAASVAAVEMAAPETLLDLQLHGVRMADDRAGAIIRTPDLRQDSYAVGQQVVPGVTLDAVRHDRVILSRNGARESLYLQGVQRPTDAAPAPVPANAAAVRPSGAAPQAGSGPMRIDGALLRGLAADLPRVARPRLRDGRLDGVAIVPTADPGRLGPLGLAPEDVILQVDGIRLTSNQNIEGALERLSEAKRLRLTVERGGSLRAIDLELEGTP